MLGGRATGVTGSGTRTRDLGVGLIAMCKLALGFTSFSGRYRARTADGRYDYRTNSREQKKKNHNASVDKGTRSHSK